VTEELDVVVATLRAYLERSKAIRAIVLLDRGDDRAPLMLDCPAGEPVEVAEGERTTVLAGAAAAAAAAAEPLPLGDVRAMPAVEVDAGSASIAALPGVMEHAARGVRDLAAALGGRTVVTVQLATTDAETPLAIAARTGEPVVLVLGDEQFPMPEDWPR